MHNKLTNLVKAASELEKEYIKLKNEGSIISEVDRQQIVDEYKASSELTEVVLGQFEEGYQCAKTKMKARMIATGLDPQLLNSFDEESKAKGDPPSPQ